MRGRRKTEGGPEHTPSTSYEVYHLQLRLRAGSKIPLTGEQTDRAGMRSIADELGQFLGVAVLTAARQSWWRRSRSAGT